MVSVTFEEDLSGSILRRINRGVFYFEEGQRGGVFEEDQRGGVFEEDQRSSVFEEDLKKGLVSLLILSRI